MENQSNAGARSKCTPELTHDVFKLILDGEANIDICKKVGISETQFYAWQREESDSYNPQFTQSIALARAQLREKRLNEMEKSLYRAATGYVAEDSRTEFGTDKDGRVYVKKKLSFKKTVPPDTKALIFALTNENPDKWKNRQNTEITGKDGKDFMNKEIDMESLTDEQKSAILTLGEQAIKKRETDGI